MKKRDIDLEIAAWSVVLMIVLACYFCGFWAAAALLH